MNQIGFGVMVRGKPSGIWPYNWAQAVAKARRERLLCSDVSIVPIFIGASIEVIIPLTEKENA